MRFLGLFRLSLLLCILFCILGSWFRLFNFIRPFQGEWGWVAIIVVADLSAILSVVRIIQRIAPWRIVLDTSALLLSLASHYTAFFFCTFPDGYNPLFVAAISLGVGFCVLVLATGKELVQKTTGKWTAKSAYLAITLYRKAGPATALFIASLVSLLFIWPLFIYIDHMWWASLPSDPWRGGDLVSGNQQTRFEVLMTTFVVCGSLYNLISCGLLSTYHGKAWKGGTAEILLSAVVLAGSVPLLGLADGIRKYLGGWPWELGHALYGLGFYLVPAIFVVEIIAHFRLSAKSRQRHAA